MDHKRITRLALATVVSVVLSLNVQAKEPVTMDNFVRAETDRYFARFVMGGGLGKFRHVRNLTPIEAQTVIRMNRDTLYSSAVFDLEAGPVTLIKPDSGDRFQSMQVINEDHFTKMVVYDAGEYELTEDEIGTRYVCVLVRTLVDPSDPADIKMANALQDQIDARQEATGEFDVPKWDQKQLTAIRDRLNKIAAVGQAISDDNSKFGDEGEVDPQVHRVATAYGWGGSPREAAIYMRGAPEKGEEDVPHTMTLSDVPADGFWSVTVYNHKGYFDKNEYDAYSVNGRNAQRNPDGSVTVHFGGDPSQPNYLPVGEGWNYVLRLFRPRQEALEGKWKFPTIEPVPARVGT